jgi:hypothetical protein
MNPDSLKAWVKKKKAGGFLQCELLAIAGLLLGLLTVFLTFWFTYAIIWFGAYGISAASDLAFHKQVHISHAMRLVCSGAFIVLLFIQHFRTDPTHWGDYGKDNYVSAPGLQMQAGVIGGLGFMLAYPGASANMVADILLVGPRLVTGAHGLMKKGFHLRKLDENGCGQLLSFLYSRGSAVPYDELKDAGWEQWFGQLKHIDGVLFLQKGLSLSQELRSELANIPTT